MLSSLLYDTCQGYRWRPAGWCAGLNYAQKPYLLSKEKTRLLLNNRPHWSCEPVPLFFLARWNPVTLSRAKGLQRRPLL
jgi:hypothetical protein